MVMSQGTYTFLTCFAGFWLIWGLIVLLCCFCSFLRRRLKRRQEERLREQNLRALELEPLELEGSLAGSPPGLAPPPPPHRSRLEAPVHAHSHVHVHPLLHHGPAQPHAHPHPHHHALPHPPPPHLSVPPRPWSYPRQGKAALRQASAPCPCRRLSPLAPGEAGWGGGGWARLLPGTGGSILTSPLPVPQRNRTCLSRRATRRRC